MVLLFMRTKTVFARACVPDVFIPAVRLSSGTATKRRETYESCSQCSLKGMGMATV